MGTIETVPVNADDTTMRSGWSLNELLPKGTGIVPKSLSDVRPSRAAPQGTAATCRGRGPFRSGSSGGAAAFPEGTGRWDV